MVTAPIDNGYTRENKIIFFRKRGALTIPKAVREVAFSLCVDVEIISSLSEDYSNYKIYPSESQYGYAVLVFYDSIRVVIPLKFGKNNIFQERNESAYSTWENYKSYAFTKYDFYRETNVIGQLASNLGFTVTPNPYPSPDYKGFIEIPLREVYVSCPYGTTFSVEVLWEKVVSFTDMDGNDIAGSSRREDYARKDGGLPSGGIKPQKPSDKDKPYDGFPPPSTPEEQGGFYNPKLPTSDAQGLFDLDRPNPLNAPKPTGTGGAGENYRIGITVTSLQSGGVIFSSDNYIASIPAPILEGTRTDLAGYNGRPVAYLTDGANNIHIGDYTDIYSVSWRYFKL